MEVPALTRLCVKDEWIDENDHMNSAMYFVAVREASGPLLRQAGFDREFVGKAGLSLVQREAHIRYARELRRGDPILVRAFIAGVDQRSVHVVSEMQHGEAGWTAAVVELLYTLFDRATRTSTAWPPEMQAALRALADASRPALSPDWVSRRVAVRST